MLQNIRFILKKISTHFSFSIFKCVQKNKIKIANLRIALLLNRQSLRRRLKKEKQIVRATIAYISKL